MSGNDRHVLSRGTKYVDGCAQGICLVPRLSWGEEEREPGTDRSRMRLIYQHSGITVFLQDTFRISSGSDVIRQILNTAMLAPSFHDLFSTVSFIFRSALAV